MKEMNRIALLFPGQGSQYVGMGKRLYDEYEVARETFEEANDVLGFDLKGLCFHGDLSELSQTENTQPALLTASVAAYRVYMEQIGIQPLLAAGHSLGEYSALVCSGALTFAEALKIVRLRGQYMQQASLAGIGKMASISQYPLDEIEQLCHFASTSEQQVRIACYNSPSQSVISGHASAVQQVAAEAAKAGAKVIELNVSAAFHSSLMEEAEAKLKAELQKYTFNKPNWPIISNVTGLPYMESADVAELLTRQMVYPVLWNQSMDYLQKQAIAVTIELGPKKVLTNLLKASLHNGSSLQAMALESKEEVEMIKQALHKSGASKPAGEKEIPGLAVIASCIAAAVSTKNRNWDSQAYQTGVAQPYREVKRMYELLESNKQEPSAEQIQLAIRMLQTVLETKKAPVEQQQAMMAKIKERAALFGAREVKEAVGVC
ncbi:malonyl CoA-acyl carrier protein transacylase [Paenibacillus curdlanolyticus YK9]|uniref:[acyl-carrier-protein] S-malonyltransferase n=1 Tax=Paenibacillus curdlanolyticus YK9 TaxID=717606 RepID=E0I4M9_9BACL|nr:ACP S-malonyltransferase [Paenibacillus curdlanolyticus]EFM12560.1 malonyl CoA-acyl carrier protein transacylase [Paenibacillus curdlanolyticus YK9]